MPQTNGLVALTLLLPLWEAVVLYTCMSGPLTVSHHNLHGVRGGGRCFFHNLHHGTWLSVGALLHQPSVLGS